MAENDGRFVPRGAIAFFAAMMAFYAVIFAAFVALMVSRG